MVALLLLVTFISSSTVVWLLLEKKLGKRASMERRLSGVTASVGTQQKARAEREPKRSGNANARSDQPLGPFTPLITPLIRLFEKDKGKPKQKQLSLMLARAGVPLKPAEFLAANVAAAGIGAVVGLVILPLPALLKLICGGLIGWFAPRYYLNILFNNRRKAFSLMLPEVLTMISNSLRAGFSFLQAMEVIAREMRPPVSSEFDRVLREQQFGIDLQVALEEMAKRVGDDDLDLIITAVLINRQVGGNLSEILDSISTTLRERMAMRGQIKALTAQGRMSGMVISMLPFGLMAFLYLSNRAYISLLFSEPLGKVLIGVWLTGQTIGMLVIKKITAIKI